MTIPRYALSYGLAAALAAAMIVPTSAAPVLSNTAAVKAAASDTVTEVRWRGGPAIAAGIGAGIALGALAASQPRYPYYGPTYYSEPYYGPTYGSYEPYYEPAPVYGYGYGYGYNYHPYPGQTRYYQGRADTATQGVW